MNKNILIGLAIALAACSKEKAPPTVIQTEVVGRRTITVAAEATGTVEPVNVVEVKSKASGQITSMTVETGSEVKRGDLLVQLDTRDVDQQWEQARADRDAAKSRYDVALDTRARERSLYEQRVMTLAEFQQGLSDSASAQTAYVRAEANLNLAEQRRDDATVRAPIEGTVIEKTVSEGSVITSSTGSMGAGTTLLKMADLSTVRVRAHFNETDIANVQAGLAATVTVAARPACTFAMSVSLKCARTRTVVRSAILSSVVPAPIEPVDDVITEPSETVFSITVPSIGARTVASSRRCSARSRAASARTSADCALELSDTPCWNSASVITRCWYSER